VVVKQRDKIETLEADLEVDFSANKGYSVLPKSKRNRLAGKPPVKGGFSLFIGAVILSLFALGLIFLVAVLFQPPGNIDSGSKVSSLEKRIKRLEERLDRIDRFEANLEQVKKKNKQSNSFNDTFIKKSITPPKSSTAQTAEKQIEAVYHEVLAGETLYRISLRYNIKLDALRRLNNLEPEATIYPNQKVLIRPAGNQ
jgi:LysM repeat protein